MFSIFGFFLILIFLQEPLANFIPQLQFLDEIFLIISICWLILSFRVALPNIMMAILLFLAYVFLISVSGDYWRGFTLTFLDIVLFLKPVAAFVIFQSIRTSWLIKAGNSFATFSVLYFFSSLIFLPIFYLLDLNSELYTRFGIPSYSFISENPGAFQNSILVAFIFSYIKLKNSRLFLIFCFTLLVISTLRFKAFVMLGILYSLYIAYELNWKSNPNLKIYKIRYLLKRLPLYFPLLFISAYLGWSQLQNYFFTEGTSPRLILTVEGWNIFLEYFPFGSGAGTYGSGVASMFYSPIYESLGFKSFHGLSGEVGDTNFLNDQFWPLVLAQYGLFGLFFVLYFASNIFKNVIKDIKASKTGIFLFYLMVSNIILSTAGSSIIIGFWGILFVFTLSYIKLRYAKYE